jgi:hypothetical protein
MQPTREEFQVLRETIEDLREKVRRIEEGQLSPLHLTIERRYFDAALQEVKDNLASLSREHANALWMHTRHIGEIHGDITLIKNDIQGEKADILALRESQADMRDAIERIENKIAGIENTMALMATKQDMQQMKADILAAINANKKPDS